MPRSQHPGREGVGHARQPAHLPRAYLSRAPPLTSGPRPPPAGSSIPRRRRSRPSAATQTYFSRRPFRAPPRTARAPTTGATSPSHVDFVVFFFPPYPRFRISRFATPPEPHARFRRRRFRTAGAAHGQRDARAPGCNAVVSVSKKIN